LTRRVGVALLAVLVFALAGCATTLQTGAPSRVSQLPGWAEEDHAAAFAALRAGCGLDHAPSAQKLCASARAAGPLGERAARAFLERRLRPEPVAGDGVLTAYFAPGYEARTRREAAFSAPVRPRPAGAEDTASRAEIEARPAPDALAWMHPEDLFFLQIEGGGVLTFPDGRRMRASFAGANGRPFVAVSGPMAAQGLIPRARASAGAIHDWLAAHRGPEADAIMRLDPRYVFFRLTPNSAGEAVGAAGTPLTAGHSIAVDRRFHAWGEIFWIDAEAPTLTGAALSYRRLVLALDTGSAIRGEVRADLYIGQGRAAGEEAGRVRHRLKLWRLVPADSR
jgi:membrane-bound lytic murein transglycosylase A